MMKHIIAVIVLSISVFSVAAEVSTLRCGTKIINIGDRNFEVYRKCGEPAFRNFVGYTDEVKGGYLPIEEWIYNSTLGSGNNFNLLRFEGGKLVKIESHYSAD